MTTNTLLQRHRAGLAGLAAAGDCPDITGNCATLYAFGGCQALKACPETYTAATLCGMCGGGGNDDDDDDGGTPPPVIDPKPQLAGVGTAVGVVMGLAGIGLLYKTMNDRAQA